MRTTSLAAAFACHLWLRHRCGPTTPEDPAPPDPVTVPELELAAAVATNLWTTKAPMPAALSDLAAGVVNGVIYTIAGVDTGDTRVATVQAYTPGSNSWVTRASLPSARSHLNGAGTISGVLYVAGGLDSSGLEIKPFSLTRPRLTPGQPRPQC
jgi:hypothetical protein